MKLTIFQFIRNSKDNDRIMGKQTLRVTNVHDSFIGIGERDREVNRAEFRKLADVLEPYNEGFLID